MPPANANEQTPLLQTVIIAPRRQRYSHSYIRRFCTVALGLVLFIVLVLFLIPGRFLPGNRSESEWVPLPWSKEYPQGSWPASNGLTYSEVQKILLETPSADRAKEWSEYYTAGPHLAGKNLSQAEWTRDRWQEFGIQSLIVQYEIYINYPVSHRLALLEGEESKKVKYECVLEEDVLKGDPTTGLEDRIPTFHGYSASGNVTGQYVYVNFGTFWDFEDLVKAGVELEGKIALAKYSRVFRGLKVKRAQELGMIGAVIYTDPQEDGDVTEANSHKPYPDGPARNPSSVQRGSVQFISKSTIWQLCTVFDLTCPDILPGDPTTPGYPSLPGVPRTDPHYSTPEIPSIPISYEDALPILRALNGHGPKASDFNGYWQGGGLSHKGVEYNIGPTPPNVTLNLHNQQDYVVTPLWDVIGIINGTIPDEVLVMGNHRDAWIAGGAADPNSGSSALNEVIRSFGTALKRGWKPLRTIVFASWDGEEYGLIGSTEWVEEYLPWLSKTAVAYLNIDVATSGPSYRSAASPILNKAVHEATALVQSPNQTVKGQTVADTWDGDIMTMGSGSDFTAFQDFAGIPSVDMAFVGGPGQPVYHYHSNYDSFAWMDSFGDPSWAYHITISKILGLLALSVVETPVLGLNATEYAAGLAKYLDKIKASVKSSNSTAPPATKDLFSNTAFPTISHSVSHLHRASVHLDAYAAHLRTILAEGIPWWRWWRKAQLYRQVRAVNRKYIDLERQFLYPKGLDSRPWFKHVVFAPGIWTGYSGATFPGLVEALDDGRDGDVEVKIPPPFPFPLWYCD